MTPSNIRSDLRSFLSEHAVVRGEVVLSSGQTAQWYADLRRATLDGRAARWVGALMLELTQGWDYDAVGGLTLGADPIALATSIEANRYGRRMSAFIVRKEGKRHGMGKRVEGPDIVGRRVLVVEDVSTTGSSALTAVDAVLAEGATVVGVAALLDRGGSAAVTAAGLEFRAAFVPADLGV